MRCMVHNIDKVTTYYFRATPKRRKVFVLHALHGVHAKNGLRILGQIVLFVKNNYLRADPLYGSAIHSTEINFLFKNESSECRLC
jgi:hypothetical protein